MCIPTYDGGYGDFEGASDAGSDCGGVDRYRYRWRRGDGVEDGGHKRDDEDRECGCKHEDWGCGRKGGGLD